MPLRIKRFRNQFFLFLIKIEIKTLPNQSKSLLYKIPNFREYVFQMIDNDVIESEYVGWAIQPITSIGLNVTADVTGWENTSELRVIKNIAVELVNKKNYGFFPRGNIICAVNIKDNHTLSEVSKMVYPVV